MAVIMATSQKYSLRWNDFSLNVATTFRDLHSQQDFVDVTLACADGSTIDAHKVILSSVSSYFRDILKNAPCKHPIIILKDTLREEAQAMLEFAYTGEVNVGQDLLPSLLHTARCYKIKGLDNVQTPPGLLDHNANPEHEWAGSRPPTRPHTPSTRPHSPRTRPSTPSTRPQSPHSNLPHSPNSVLSAVDALKPVSDHYLGQGQSPLPAPLAHAHSSTSHSQPPTRPASPVCNSLPPSPQSNARTPPPKRWKRSFDLARNDDGDMDVHQKQGGRIVNDISNGAEFGESVAKRFCEKRYSLETEREKRFGEADSNHSNQSQPTGSVSKRFVEPGNGHERGHGPMYPHSMPASPTMFDARNINSLGILRHFARVGSQDAGENANAHAPREAHDNSRSSSSDHAQNSAPSHALDYRFHPADQSEGHRRQDREENEAQRRQRLTVFRPESAPTLPSLVTASSGGPLDMSPEASLSGPPSAHDMSTDGIEHDERLTHFRNIVVGTLQPVSSSPADLSDCVSKALNTSGGAGRYSCDECGKLFKHPGSLQHHRHIHRGTHKCPSCGKAFSRRWDMERHLNKSKYGCPANRFSGGAGDRSLSDLSEGDLSNQEGPVSLVSTSTVVSNNLPHEAAMVTLLPSHINGSSH